MATIFTRIANGEIPSYKCAENEDFYAFLDIAQMAKGHTLVIPKHVEDDYIFHLDEKTIVFEGGGRKTRCKPERSAPAPDR